MWYAAVVLFIVACIFQCNSDACYWGCCHLWVRLVCRRAFYDHERNFASIKITRKKSYKFFVRLHGENKYISSVLWKLHVILLLQSFRSVSSDLHQC